MAQDPGITQKTHNELVLSFLAVRRAIGGLGFFLPVALIVFAIATGNLPPSISDAYFTPMRDVFVGVMIAQAVFLWSYEGFRPNDGEIISDRITARIAAIAAMLVALAPTRITLPDGAVAPADCTLLQCVLGPEITATVHLLAAAVFFGALAVYCLVLFVRGTVDGPEKRASNLIYRICGWLIVASIGLIGVLIQTGLAKQLSHLNPVFWLETIACFAFATSWMVKGDTMRPLVRALATPA